MNRPRQPACPKKPATGFSLVLAGGLARGAAHLGVWRALSEIQLVPERVIGVSIGAIIGGWLCRAGGTGDALSRISDLARSMHPTLSANSRNFFDAWRLISLRQRRLFIEETLNLKGVTFGQLPLPLYVVATRLLPPGRVVFGDHPTQPVAEAILASTAVPSHLPVRVGRSYYFDGGLSGNLPVMEAAKRGGRVIVAVNLGPPVRRLRGKAGEALWRFCRKVYRLSHLREMERSRARGATVFHIASPEIESHGLFAFEKLDMIEREGYKATQRVLPALQVALGRGRGDEPSTARPQGATGGS